jgi:DNA-binding transcriptional ArsR family regulator
VVNYSHRHHDRVCATLADPTRRAILARLATERSLSISDLAEPFSIKLPTVMKHIDVVGDPDLITRTKHGRRTVEVRLSPAPLRGATEWPRRYERFWSPALDSLAAQAERKEAEAHMADARAKGKGR